jgi:hypothetical protein
LPAAGFLDSQFSGYGAEHVIGGIGAAHCLVRVEYEIAAAGATQQRAECRCRFLRYRQGRERDLERRQQYATKNNIPQSNDFAVRPRTHVQGVIG